MSRILIVEDEESFSDPLSYLLQKEGFVTAVAATGPEALAEFDANGADLVLLDLMLPGLSGTEVCRALRAKSSVPIIMLTAKDSEIDKVVGLEMGADDYVTKPYSARELLARVRAVLRRLAEADEPAGAPVQAGPVRMDVDRHVVTVNGKVTSMPLKEFELLELLLRHAGRVLTRGQLIDRVWGSDYVGDTKTLDVHVKWLRAKIEPAPAAGSGLGLELLVHARGRQHRHGHQLLALRGHEVDVGQGARRAGHLGKDNALDRLGLAAAKADPARHRPTGLGLCAGEEADLGLGIALIEHGADQGAGAAGLLSDDREVATGDAAQLHRDPVARDVFVVRLHRREERAGGKSGGGCRGAGHGEGPVESLHGAQRSARAPASTGREGVVRDTSRCAGGIPLTYAALPGTARAPRRCGRDACRRAVVKARLDPSDTPVWPLTCTNAEIGVRLSVGPWYPGSRERG